MSRTPLLFALCCVVLFTSLIPQSSIQAASTPTVVTRLSLPDSDSAKYPRIAAGSNNILHVSSNPGETEIVHWQKQDSSTSNFSRESIGTSVKVSKSDYNNAAVAVGPDNTTYVVWISQGQGIFMRKKYTNGTWSARLTVAGSDSFRSAVDITVTPNNRIFVIWNDNSTINYRTSTDGGGSWTGTGQVTTKTPYGGRASRIRSGADGTVVHTHFSSTGNIIANIWDGSGFSTESVTTDGGSGDNFLSSSGVGVSPTGKIYIAWRREGGGIYYAERQSDGSWPRSKVASGSAYGNVDIYADSSSNLHLFWTSDVSGSWKMYYAYKPSSGSWQGPVSTDSAGLLANASGVATVSTNVYGHGVAERFSGDDMYTRYVLYNSGTGVATGPGATPVIGGEELTDENTVTVNLTNISGSPTLMRWRWGAEPTDSTNDSNGWQTYASTFTATTPADTNCAATTLYVQLSDGTTPGAVGTDTLIVDKTVNAYADIRNPYLPGQDYFSNLSLQDLNSQSGASNGDVNYSRLDTVALNVIELNDCSDLYSAEILQTSQLFSATANGSLLTGVALPQNKVIGLNDMTIRVTDKLGNQYDFYDAIVYDPTPPTLSGGTLTVTNNNDTSIIRNLKFSNVTVTDNLYGTASVASVGPTLPSNAQFWGVWLAVSRTAVSNPTTDTSLQWFPLAVANQSQNFSVDFSLWSGSVTRTSGTYYIYARFLDGAGNPTTQYLSTQTTLPEGYELVKDRFPLIAR